MTSTQLTAFEDAVIQLEILSDLISALDDANAEGAQTFPSTALNIPDRCLRQVSKDLRGLVDQLYAQRKKELKTA